MNKQPETWKRAASEKIADCRIFSVRKDFCERESDGFRANFFCIENPDWVNVIALTRENQIVLIRQFRHGIGQITLEIPGGMVDGDEDPQAAAERELIEETGFSADEFILLGKSHSNPAINNNLVYHYLALGCEKTRETAFDDHESVVVELVSPESIDELIVGGEITHSLVVAAFLRLRLAKRL